MTVFSNHRVWLTTLVALTMSCIQVTAAEWSVVVSPSGAVRFERDGTEIGSLVPQLYEVGWKQASMGEVARQAPDAAGTRFSSITAPSGSVVNTETRVTKQGNGVRIEYRLTPTSNLMLNSFFVGLKLPANVCQGGKFIVDGQHLAVPRQFNELAVVSGMAQSTELQLAKGATLRWKLDQSTGVMIQDDRQWEQTFSVRIGPKLNEGELWPVGKTLAISMQLEADGPMTLSQDGPVTITAGDDWLPLDVSLDIEPGSALDFSTVIPRHQPAGKMGRVIVNRQGKFAFEQQPDQPVRFYGVNLCFSAHYLSHEDADRLAERLWRLGYNALRVHHHEGELVDWKSETIQFNPEKLDQLDYLLAAMKQRGIYVTTDLFVSRPVAASLIYPGESGNIGMDEFKLAVHINERAYQNYITFARMFLEHENPYTKLRYADDPMLGWLSLVNEDNPGNFASQLKGPLHDDLKRHWNQWLSAKYTTREALEQALGDLPETQDPQKQTVPLQNVYGSEQAAIQFNVFLAEVEQKFFDRVKLFLREELQCNALLTDINAWTNPVQLQAVRESFDYVDDHFYVDHPEFLEKPWNLPSKCPNTSPIAEGATGGRSCAFTRLLNKPFTITEFNYSSPGRYRGVGGILTGTLGAIQDWDGVWRFSYAHDRENVINPVRLNYFDVSADPLNQAAERASLCLFLRGDIKPATHAISIDATTKELLEQPTTSRNKTPGWNGLAWLTKVGWRIDTPMSTSRSAEISLPMSGGNVDPFSSNAGDSLFDQLRSRSWLAGSNRTKLQDNVFQSETGEVTIDAPQNTLTLDTDRTAGGFAPAGRQIVTKQAVIEIKKTDATVWVSSLENSPIGKSKRLLMTHLTDLQNTDAKYGDQGRKVLQDWGRLPHLMQAGEAVVTLALTHPEMAKVYGLSTSGKRTGEIATRTDTGRLVIPLSVSNHGEARMLYEVVIGQ